MNSQGHLVPLKTLYELEIKEGLGRLEGAALSIYFLLTSVTVEAYVVEIPIKLASKALKWVLTHPNPVRNTCAHHGIFAVF